MRAHTLEANQLCVIQLHCIISVIFQKNDPALTSAMRYWDVYVVFSGLFLGESFRAIKKLVTPKTLEPYLELGLCFLALYSVLSSGSSAFALPLHVLNLSTQHRRAKPPLWVIWVSLHTFMLHQRFIAKRIIN